MIINPYGMEAVEWADQMTPNLSRYGIVPRLDAPELWREWAEAVCRLSPIAARNPPDPGAYGDWRAWAERFCEVPLR